MNYDPRKKGTWKTRIVLTHEQRMARRSEHMQECLEYIGRIEAAMATVNPKFLPDLQYVLDHSETYGAAELYGYVERAEGWLQHPDRTIPHQEARAIVSDLYGPTTTDGIRLFKEEAK